MSNSKQRLLIFTDGPNGGGKTTILRFLRDYVPGLTVVELHDFYHKHVLRSHGMHDAELVREEHWKRISEKSRNGLFEYSESRTDSALSFAEQCSHDDMVIERIPLTDWVYRKLLFDFDSTTFLTEVGRRIDDLGGVLLMVTTNPDTLVHRMHRALESRTGRSSSMTPYHLVEESTVRQKSVLYDQAFAKVECQNKICIDTESLSEIQLLEHIRTLLSIV